MESDINISSFVNDSASEDEEEEVNVSENESEMEWFRLYSCVDNDVNTHCVEFEDESKNAKKSFIQLPMNLRPVLDALIHAFPKKQSIQDLFDKASEDCVVSLEEVIEFVKLLNDMQLIKLTK